MKFRKLKPEEIDVRVAQIGDGWVQLLLYKDARVDMTILDETVGPENWQREHYECKGNLFCRVGINCDGQWVWKSDCGSESYTEKEKGEASDSFKRACTNWGIGRELYTKLPIFVNIETVKNGNGYKMTKKDYWNVKEVKTTDNKITYIEIQNKYGNVVFRHGEVEQVETYAEELTKPEQQETQTEATQSVQPEEHQQKKKIRVRREV